MYLVQDISGLKKPDQWEVLKNGSLIFRGSFKDTLRFTVHELKFEVRDFETAIESVVKMGHNTLHFDMYKRLTYTSHLPLNKQKKIG